MKRVTFEELDALSRVRPLTENEARRLAWAIQHKDRGDSGKGQRPWTDKDLKLLECLLRGGQKPGQIALVLKRTERAVWRKIYKEKLAVGRLCPENIFTASRLRVQSRP